MPWLDPLLRSIQYQDHEEVRSLLNTGTSPNKKSPSDPAPLLVAIEESDHSMVKLLVDHGSNVQEHDNDGESALHFATQYFVAYEVMELLVDTGADVNCLNKWGRTALHYCCSEGDLNKMELLLKSPGIDVNIQDEDGNTCLHYFLSYGEGDVDDRAFWVRGLTLLCQANVDVNISNNKTQTALHVAIKNDVDSNLALSVLLDVGFGFDFEKQDRKGNNFLYLYVSRTPEEKILHKILKFEFHALSSLNTNIMKNCINTENKYGETAFTRFLFPNSTLELNILEDFIQAGADVTKTNSLGRTPLHRILMNKISVARPGACRIFIENGADPNAQDAFGITPLLLAKSEKEVRNINAFGKADYFHSDKTGRNAIMHGLIDAKDVLREYYDGGCSVNHSDKFGSTPLHYAVWLNAVTQVEELLNMGADPELKDLENRTALSLAEYLKNGEICKVIQNFRKKSDEKSKWDSGDIEVLYQRDESEVLGKWQGNNMLLTHNKGMECMFQEVLDSIPHHVDGKNLAKQLFHLPGTGKLLDISETADIIESVNALMQRLCSRLSKRNPIFQTEIVPMGSMREGTKTGNPDEFDFVCCLSGILELCEICPAEGTNPEAFVRLKLKSSANVPCTMKEYFDEEGFFQTYKIRMKLFYLVWSILLERDIWKDNRMVYLGDDVTNGFDDKPVLNFEVNWIGSTYKYLNISIDLVPAIRIPFRIPGLFDDHNIPRVGDAGCFLLFNPPDSVSDAETTYEMLTYDECTLPVNTIVCNETRHTLMQSHFRLSSAPIEVSFIDSLPQAVRDGYILAKVMRNQCPKIQFDSSFFDDLYQQNSATLPRTVSHTMRNDAEILTKLIQNVTKQEWSYIHPTAVSNQKNESQSKDSNDDCHSISNGEDHYDNEVGTADESDSTNDSKACSTSQDLDFTGEIHIDEICKSDSSSNENSECEVSESKINVNYDCNRKRQPDCTDETRTKQSSIASSNKSRDNADIKETSKGKDYKYTSESSEDDYQDRFTANDFDWDESDDDGGPTYNAGDSISSYMLKNALFHIVNLRPALTDKTLDMKSSEERFQFTIDVALGIFQYLKTRTENINAFFIPKQNILNFRFEFLQALNEEERMRKIRSDGKLRSVFLELIVEILRHK